MNEAQRNEESEPQGGDLTELLCGGGSVTDEEILKLFERNGMRIELGAQFSAKGQIAQLLNGCRELVRKYEADARRYKYLRDNQTWHRYGTLADDDSYAIVGCKFPYLANFECKPMLDHNIDKMLEKQGT